MSGSTAILSGGAAFKPLSLNAADAQLIESRKFNVEDIARIFRVPLSLLGHFFRTTFSTPIIRAFRTSTISIAS